MKCLFDARNVMFCLLAVFLSFAPIPLKAEQYRVVSVQDDATVTAEGYGTEITVRLAGVETPGPSSITDKLTSHLFNRLMNMRVVLQLHGPTQSPIPAEIFLNRENINLEVIRQGLAKTNQNQNFSNHLAFIEAEKMAKNEKRGIWSTPAKKKKMGLIPALLLLGICGEGRN